MSLITPAPQNISTPPRPFGFAPPKKPRSLPKPNENPKLNRSQALARWHAFFAVKNAELLAESPKGKASTRRKRIKSMWDKENGKVDEKGRKKKTK